MTETPNPGGTVSEIIVKQSMTNIVAVMRSEEAADLLKQTAEGLEYLRLDIIVSPIANLEKNPRAMNGHDILLIDVAPHNEAETDHLKRYISTNHQTRPVIVTSADVSREGVQRIIQSGAAEILAQPIRQTDLVIAIDQAVNRYANMTRHLETPSGPKGKVVSFLKGGGGVGATTLALQMGGLLARDKSVACKVCVLDFDLQFGAVGLYLDIHRNVSLSDLIEAPDRIDEALLSGVMAHHASGLDVLRAPDDLLPLDAISTDFVKTLLNLARNTYDYVIIDLPQVWTEWTYVTLSQSDLMMLVTQLHVGGIRQTARQLEAIKMHDLGDIPLKLVLNRYAGGGFFSDQPDAVRDAEKALDHTFDFKLPNDFELTKTAIDRGLLFSEVKRRSKLEKKLQAMAGDLREALAPDNAATAVAVAVAVAK
jgi:pilus assembly protein CpaE